MWYFLREMNLEDYNALYQVLADSDIMQHYAYTFDEQRVRGWTFENTPFDMNFSYMKSTNLPSAKSAISWRCSKADEFEDKENDITIVYAITRDVWIKIK